MTRVLLPVTRCSSSERDHRRLVLDDREPPVGIEQPQLDFTPTRRTAPTGCLDTNLAAT
jgi:hypothetical protein